MSRKDQFSKRRKQLLEKLDKKDAVLLFGSSEQLRNGDVHFPFRQNSNFYYFTGYTEPDAVALLLPHRNEGLYILFNLKSDPLIERWTGKRVGQEGAVKSYGADQAFALDVLNVKLVELLEGCERLYYEMGNKTFDHKILALVNKLQEQNRRNYGGITLSDIRKLAGEMRLLKDHSEIELLRAAAQKSAKAHIAAMKHCRPNLYEYQLEAVINYELMQENCRSFAYPSIVGGGKNACVLHYVANDSRLLAGDLVLIDAGGEYEYYASDITRTFPINGKFSAEQAQIYNLVLKAQEEVIAAIRPGIAWSKLQEIAVSHLSKGLVSLGILKGTVAEVIKNKTYLLYYMHNVSHWLGLDVHDAGAYKIDDQWRTLEEGMVLTVEPGLYLSANKNLDKKWWDIGVRIEDDILVTPEGCEVLTKDVPKEISEIEAIMTA